VSAWPPRRDRTRPPPAPLSARRAGQSHRRRRSGARGPPSPERDSASTAEPRDPPRRARRSGPEQLLQEGSCSAARGPRDGQDLSSGSTPPCHLERTTFPATHRVTPGRPTGRHRAVECRSTVRALRCASRPGSHLDQVRRCAGCRHGRTALRLAQMCRREKDGLATLVASLMQTRKACSMRGSQPAVGSSRTSRSGLS